MSQETEEKIEERFKIESTYNIERVKMDFSLVIFTIKVGLISNGSASTTLITVASHLGPGNKYAAVMLHSVEWFVWGMVIGMIMLFILGVARTNLANIAYKELMRYIYPHLEKDPSFITSNKENMRRGIFIGFIGVCLLQCYIFFIIGISTASHNLSKIAITYEPASHMSDSQ